MTKWIVVGAGLTGATLAERIVTVLKQPVTIFEKKSYVGGAAADYIHSTGLLVPRFGPHVFHTNSDKIWNYVNQFSGWKSCNYKVSANVNEKLIPLPLGFSGIDLIYNKDSFMIKDSLIKHYGNYKSVSLPELQKSTDPIIKDFYLKIKSLIFNGYTKKHWGRDIDQLSPSVISRVPIIIGDQDSYFADKYQAVPANGYTAMIQNMISNSKIKIELGTEYKHNNNSDASVLYTGSLDSLFNDSTIKFPYRTVEFLESVIDNEYAQSVATINYPNKYDFTRETEPKHLTGQISDKTVVIREWPKEHQPGITEPLYPVPGAVDPNILYKHQNLAKERNIITAGRLGTYKYLNMDQAIGNALSLFSKLI